MKRRQVHTILVLLTGDTPEALWAVADGDWRQVGVGVGHAAAHTTVHTGWIAFGWRAGYGNNIY